MIEFAFLILIGLAQDRLPDAPPQGPGTVEEAIAACESREYSRPQEAIGIARAWLSGKDPLAPVQRGLLLSCLAWARMQTGEMAEARDITRQVSDLADSLTEPEGRVAILSRLASLEYRSGDAVAALQVIETALDLTEAHELDHLLAELLGSIAMYLAEAQQYDSAIDHYERLLALPREDDTRPEALLPIRYNFARTLMMDGQHERALEQLDLLIPMLQAPELAPRLATALSMSGNAWRRLGDLERAQELTDQAAALHEGFDNPAERSVLKRDQALLAREMGDLEAAEAFIREALALAERIEFERLILDAMVNLSEILEAQGRYREALGVHRDYAGRNIEFLEAAQRSRLDALETELGMQRQAQELYELRRTADIQTLQLADEAFRRQVMLGALAAILALAIGLMIWQRRNQKQLLETSRRDSLTGLANRRFLTLQMQSHGSNPRQAAVLLVDLDHFKQINDRYGHDMGDRVLIEVSRLLRDVAAEHAAMCGRWGGEEFALYLPNATPERTQALATAIRTRIAALSVRGHDRARIGVTASLGFAPTAGFVQESGEEAWEPALKAADQLLYQAKNQGRDRVLGVWPMAEDDAINPLGMDQAIASGALRRLVVE
jgi:diguanylate cyclase (GGDEF)-like protein